MTNGPFYTYHRIHSTSGNAHFMDICMYVCLSVCLSFCHIPFVRSILERSRKLYFSEQVAPHASEWWRNSKIKRSTVKVTGNTKMKKNRFHAKIGSIYLRQTKIKMSRGPFDTYHRIHFINENAPFRDICLSVCLPVLSRT